VRPENEGARQTYVEMMAALRNMDELIETCRRCIELTPEDPFYYFYLGKAYFTKGMIREGKEAFERCRKLNPTPYMIREMDRLIRSFPSSDSGEHR
jgi:tetratricopeptide (TPR) repeat protein